MPKKLIEQTDIYEVYHHTGKTTFRGCQCFKDCTCNEDFVSEPYDYYTVKKLFNKIKTTNHHNLESVQERIALLKTLPINYYQDKKV